MSRFGEAAIGRTDMTRHENLERTDVCEEAHFVDLLNYTVDLDVEWDELNTQPTISVP